MISKFRVVASEHIANLVVREQCVVALHKPLAAITGQYNSPRWLLRTVTGNAMLVPDGLDVPRVVEDFRHVCQGRYPAGGTLECLGKGRVGHHLGPLLVTAHAGTDLPGHDRQKTEHAFD